MCDLDLCLFLVFFLCLFNFLEMVGKLSENFL